MLLHVRFSVLLALATCGLCRGETAVAERERVHPLKITILDTFVAGGGIGEWGFSALVEADGHRILYDTGALSDAVLRNARQMKVDLSNVDDVVLSHNHPDHVGGILALRESIMVKFPGALARAHVGDGIFALRFPARNVVRKENAALSLKADYEKIGGKFIVHAGPVELYPGVWLTGPVPRKSEPCGGASPASGYPGDWDTMPEDMALVCNTDQGLVVLTGCGHAGAINVVTYAQEVIRPARVHALIGGLHLDAATEETVAWTADRLRATGVDHLLGAHCTGFEIVARFRRELGLDRAHAVVAAVGCQFELGKGIDLSHAAK